MEKKAKVLKGLKEKVVLFFALSAICCAGINEFLDEIKEKGKIIGGVFIALGLFHLFMAGKEEDGSGKSKAVVEILVGLIMVGGLTFMTTTA